MGVNHMGEVSCNFLKKHDAEGHTAEEYQRPGRLFRHMMVGKPPAAGAEEEGCIEEKEGVVEPL